VLVQGDTTTAMATALASFHLGIPVGHVEAGLRTGDLSRPFPEEANRRIIDVVSAAHFAPTSLARDSLRAEGADPETVYLTGNTIVDALESVVAGLGPPDHADEVLVTLHRRESFGAPLAGMLDAVCTLAASFPATRFVLPVHPNPSVSTPVHAALGGIDNVTLCDPLDYRSLIEQLRRSRLVLTDSGGIQEEAPAFRVPVLVLRELTERPEGIEAGVARLVGVDPERIVATATEVLALAHVDEPRHIVTNPYGDGHAAERIVAILAGEPWEPFRASAPVREDVW
jgi:UDP-N-acetylglucosamine 2-epimerase (non-hydrolysing)